MLAVISPAKRLDWTDRNAVLTQPEFAADAVRLSKTARNLTLGQLRSLMGLSDDLARLNRDRFKAFAATPAAGDLRPAAHAFAGDTYMGLDAVTLGKDDLAFAQDHLRILSGLYGILRPFDGIQPYRLEMGSRLRTRRGQTLYAYWGAQIAKALNAQAEVTGSNVLVNCASQEYFGAVDLTALSLRVVTPTFLEERNGTAKVISFFAKRARGAMARHLIQSRATNVDDVLGFSAEGYRYDKARSAKGAPVFVRSQAETARAVA